MPIEQLVRKLRDIPARLSSVTGARAGRTGVSGLPSVLITRHDERYVELQQGFNQRWRASPSQIRLATCTRDVAEIVRETVVAGRRLSVRSGGHCSESFVYNPDSETVLDLSQLNEIGYDARHNAISVGAGATLASLYAALYRTWGVTLPGAYCSTVGIGGHLVGGGHGPLSRLHGLTVDYLYGVEVVVVDQNKQPRTIVATRNRRDPHRALWWAHTGGGGGNFGVVTRYLLRDPHVRSHKPEALLPTPPAEVYLSAVAIDWAQVTWEAFDRLVQNFGEWHERNSTPDSPYAGLFSMLKLNKQTRDDDGNPAGQIVLVTQMDATAPDSRQLLDTYLAEVLSGVAAPTTTWRDRSGDHDPLPQFSQPRRVPWLAATLLLGGAPISRRADDKSAYLRTGPTADQIRTTYAWLTSPTYNNPHALVQIDSHGCAINQVPASATAVPQRDSVLKAHYQTYWDNPEEDDTHLTWMRKMYKAIYAATSGVPAPVENSNTDGCSINYPDIDLSDPTWNPDYHWSTLYYKNLYPRLQEVKRQYDPRNVFNHAQSIVPAPGTE